MRKWNALLTVGILVLFVIHMIWGGLELTGMTKGGSTLYTALSHTLMLLIALHMLIGIKLTIDTVRIGRRAGVHYGRQNLLFWVRRISGFALMLFLLVHVLIFMGNHDAGAYRLNRFGGVQLASQLLLVASLLVHLLCNITPLRIALGLGDQKNFRTDVLLVLAILLVLAGGAFVVYFTRWQTV